MKKDFGEYYKKVNDQLRKDIIIAILGFIKKGKDCLEFEDDDMLLFENVDEYTDEWISSIKKNGTFTTYYDGDEKEEFNLIDLSTDKLIELLNHTTKIVLKLK